MFHRKKNSNQICGKHNLEVKVLSRTHKVVFINHFWARADKEEDYYHLTFKPKVFCNLQCSINYIYVKEDDFHNSCTNSTISL